MKVQIKLEQNTELIIESHERKYNTLKLTLRENDWYSAKYEEDTCEVGITKLFKLLNNIDVFLDKVG